MYIYPAEMGTALVWNHICIETEREIYIYIRVCVLVPMQAHTGSYP